MSSTGSPQGFPNIDQPIAGPGGIISRPWLQLLIALWNRTGAAKGGTIVPSGMMGDFAGPSGNIPPGWLLCGPTYLIADFPNLYAAIGTTWGGDGVKTFGTPPQNIFAKGLGSDQVGDTGGEASTTLTVGQLPAHNHGVTDPGHTHVVTDPGHTHVVTDPGHTHAITDPGHAHTIPATGTGGGATAGGTAPGTTNTGNANTGITINSATTGVTNQDADTGVTNQDATTGITTQDTGSGDPVALLPPYATFLKIIKT